MDSSDQVSNSDPSSNKIKRNCKDLNKSPESDAVFKLRRRLTPKLKDDEEYRAAIRKKFKELEEHHERNRKNIYAFHTTVVSMSRIIPDLEEDPFELEGVPNTIYFDIESQKQGRKIKLEPLPGTSKSARVQTTIGDQADTLNQQSLSAMERAEPNSSGDEGRGLSDQVPGKSKFKRIAESVQDTVCFGNGITEVKERYFQVKWKEMKELEWVTDDVAKTHFPDLVIKFYEDERDDFQK